VLRVDDDGVPVLSAAAPFKARARRPRLHRRAGGRHRDPQRRRLLYPNGPCVRVKGDIVREWLEMSAGQFNRIDPPCDAQPLINTTFDV
jgi:hypothetical protein